MSLIRVRDKLLEKDVLGAIIECDSKLVGDYDYYCVYEKDNREKYALLYAFYKESEAVLRDNFQYLAQKDGEMLHYVLKEKHIDIDYIFVVPYFDFKNGVSITGSAVVTENI